MAGCASVALMLPSSAWSQDSGLADTLELGTIVVTASGVEQNVADAPASISVISREDLESGAFRDLSDALKEVQGVVTTGVANEQDIQIRGLPGDYTLILVDGRRQGTRESRPNGSAGYEQSFIPPISAIDRIEVVRGPMSSLYGSDAMGGVINIITRDASDVWSGSFTVDSTAQERSEFGNTQQLSFNMSGPLVQDKLSLQIWGRLQNREEDHQIDGIQGGEERNLASRLTYTPNADHEFSLEAGHSRVRRESSAGRTLEATDDDSYQNHDRNYFALGYTGHWGRVKTDLSYQVERGTRTSYDRDPLSRDFEKNDRAPEIQNAVLDAKLSLPFEFFGGHTFVAGFQHSSAKLTDQGHVSVDQEMRVDQRALFFEDEWRLSDSFALTGGLRLDDHDTYGTNVSPRLYAVWHATHELTIKGGVSTGFKAPTIRQVADGYYLPTQRGAGLLAGNPDLDPEKSISYEIGAIWEGNGGFSFGATAFHTDFRDKISNMNTGQLINPDTGVITDPLGGADCNSAALAAYPGNSCLWQSFNIDDAAVRGIELSSTWEATQNLTLRGTYTYTDSEQKTGQYAGFPLQRTPRNRATLRADWVTPWAGVDLWSAATYHGAELNAGARIGGNGSSVKVDGQDGREYSAYTLVDLGGSWRVSDTVTVNGAIYNLLDETVEQDTHNTLVEGRRLWVGVTTSF
ncbi:hypothetical protein P775_22645 [Puniceibacterium antarcticum]|uniref:Ligand-gated channel protein n=2 Tax=Puniceibacterium antarcticum TaxID=1206336 RepID=A0A2G8R8I9_9RHOB|nr:hypothetical protein P775_22645 [Puniceibacterium antarcticum]